MSIRFRITLLIVLSFVAIFSIGGYSIFQTRATAIEVKRVTESVVPSALASSDLLSHLKEVQLLTVALVAEPDGHLAAQTKEKLIASKTKLEEGVNYQLKQATDKTQQGLVEQINESLSAYIAAIDETIQFKTSGQNSLAEASYHANVVVYQRELQQILDTLRIEKNRTKDTAIHALNENLSSASIGMSVVTVVAIVILTAFGFVLYRQITDPISEMQSMMSEIATSQDFIPENMRRAFCAAYASSDMEGLRKVIDEYIFCLVYPNALVRGISEITETVLAGQFRTLKIFRDTPYIVRDRIIFGDLHAVHAAIVLNDTFHQGDIIVFQRFHGQPYLVLHQAAHQHHLFTHLIEFGIKLCQRMFPIAHPILSWHRLIWRSMLLTNHDRIVTRQRGMLTDDQEPRYSKNVQESKRS